MNYSLKLSLLLLCVTSCVTLAKDINILFIGNSFTFRHDLPELVKEVFEEGHPDLKVNVERVVYGGQDLFRHHDLYHSDAWVRLNSITAEEIKENKAAIQKWIDADQPPEFYQAYWQKTGQEPMPWENIQNRLETALEQQDALLRRVEANQRVKWDYIVLQSWQDVVPDIDAGYGEYAQKFAKIANDEGSKVILYVTAPHAQNEQPVTEPLKWEQTASELTAIKKLEERIQPFAVVPVGLGIASLQKKGTDFKFRYVKDFHLNQTCAFLTANMFYSAFFNRSPEELQFNRAVENIPKGGGPGKDPDGGNAEVVFSDADKTTLQQAAHQAVEKFRAGDLTP